MYNASDRKDIRRAERVAKVAETLRVEHIHLSMQTRSGRAWFHNILSHCKIFDGTFTGDALFEAFDKGQRNIGLMIYNDIVTTCPDLFVMMMREANSKEISNGGRSDAEQSGSEDGDGGVEGSEGSDA